MTTTNIRRVTPVLKESVRELCARPYHGHPKGCPNYSKRLTCPPAAPLLAETLELGQPIWAAFNRFDLARHVAKMQRRHPEWSQRQLECCLYWQGTARKALRFGVQRFLEEMAELYGCSTALLDLRVLYAPEACGVDVTATMASIGVHLEWPPRKLAYQVALIGKAKGK